MSKLSSWNWRITYKMQLQRQQWDKYPKQKYKQINKGVRNKKKKEEINMSR
jgi:hypothetical protein